MLAGGVANQEVNAEPQGQCDGLRHDIDDRPCDGDVDGAVLNLRVEAELSIFDDDATLFARLLLEDQRTSDNGLQLSVETNDVIDVAREPDKSVTLALHNATVDDRTVRITVAKGVGDDVSMGVKVETGDIGAEDDTRAAGLLPLEVKVRADDGVAVAEEGSDAAGGGAVTKNNAGGAGGEVGDAEGRAPAVERGRADGAEV